MENENKIKKISVVIPCYRSENTIEVVVDRCIHTMEKDGRFDYEIVCINDYSPDGTILTLRKMACSNPKIKVVNLARNFGQHGALMAGFHYVTGDVIVCLDDDGENPPEQMFRLIDKLDEGYDWATARYTKDKRSLIRTIGTQISFEMSTRLVGKPKEIEINSYSAFRRFIADEIIKYENPYPFVHGLMLRVTRNIANVDMPREERMEGKSGYTFRKLFSLWMNGFTAFSEKPLRLASYVGIFASFLGFVFSVYVIVKKILHPEIPAGYSSVMAVMLILFGIVMLFLGLLGEYIGRIYICLNNAPQFVVRDTMNLDGNSGA
jgi:undecaprenyl-phosphate 4-deoxy-4-formamido-L-arabinose transferase